MISLPIPSETEQLVAKLSNEEKEKLALLISAFVARPKRNMAQVMDDMASHAKKQGLDTKDLGGLLSKD